MMRKRSDKGYTKLNKHEKLGHAHDILLISRHTRIRTLTGAPAGSLHLILTYLLTSVQSKWRRLARSTGRRAKLTIHRRHFFSWQKFNICVTSAYLRPQSPVPVPNPVWFQIWERVTAQEARFQLPCASASFVARRLVSVAWNNARTWKWVLTSLG